MTLGVKRYEFITPLGAAAAASPLVARALPPALSLPDKRTQVLAATGVDHSAMGGKVKTASFALNGSEGVNKAPEFGPLKASGCAAFHA